MTLSEKDILRIVEKQKHLQKQIVNELRKEQQEQEQITQVTKRKQQLNSLVLQLQGAVINVSIIDHYQTQTQSNQVTIDTTKGKIRVDNLRIVQEA